MFDNDTSKVSALTGTFAVIRPAAEATRTGDTQAASGNILPPAEKPDLEKLAKELNVASQAIGRDLRFQVDMESGRSVIQVLDRETGEIIRQIPPENAKTYVSDSGVVALRLYNNQA